MPRTISGTYAAGITLTNTANNPVSISASAKISKTAGTYGALYAQGGNGNTWTIDNSGKITGGNGGTNTGGIYLGGFDSAITNGVVTNEAGGTVAGARYAIFANGPIAVTNKSGGKISAISNAAMYLRSASSVINYGVITDTNNSAIYLGGGGSVTNNAGATISGASLGVQLAAVGTVINSGTITGTSTYAVLFGASSASNALVVDPGASFGGRISGGGGKVELAVGNGSASSLGTFSSSGITNFSKLQFDSGAKWTVTGNTSSSGLGTLAITCFAANDTIHLTGFVATSSSFSSNALVLTNASSAHSTLHIQGAFSTSDFHVAPDGGSFVTATCYAAGTHILTPSGEIAIEHLHAGDLVQTISGRTQPIRWIGRRHVEFQRHPHRQRILPVRIAAHAFGEDRPKRDLLLSPDHAVFVDGVLIPIRHLINGGSITQLDRHAITYYHIELPQHDVLLAEGLPAESYLEAGGRSAFGNSDAVIQLHPEFTPPQDHHALLWEQQGYAPLVVTGETLERVRASLAASYQRAA